MENKKVWLVTGSGSGLEKKHYRKCA